MELDIVYQLTETPYIDTSCCLAAVYTCDIKILGCMVLMSIADN